MISRSRSLFNNLFLRDKYRNTPYDSVTSWQPFPMLDALAIWCGLLGRPTTTAQLSAALPVNDGDMAAQFVPLACARLGLDARWMQISLAQMVAGDFPALLRLADGGAVLALALRADGAVRLRDANGEMVVAQADLDALGPCAILSGGHVDPVNGNDEDAARDVMRRNPRLWLLGAFLGERRTLQKMAMAGLLLNLCALAVPLYMRAIYDRVVPNLALESLWALSVGVVIVLFFELMLKQIKSAFTDGIGLRVGQAVQHKAIGAVLGARQKAKRQDAGMLMTGLRDIEQLSLLVPQAILTFLIDVPCILGFFGLIALIGGWTIAGPIIGAVLLVMVGLITNYALKLASKRASKLMQARQNLIVEVAEGWTTIKANQAEGRFLAKWNILADHLGIAGRDGRHWHDMPAVAAGFAVQLVTVMVVIIGVFQIKSGALTTGAMIAVIMLTGRAMVPVSAAIATVAKLYQNLSQIAALADILQAEQERQQSDPAIGDARIKGQIRAKGLHYTFEGAAEKSLENVHITIEPGEKIALIGRTGSGKSTLLQILAGLMPISEGKITVDGHAIDRFATAHLRRDIVYSAQDASLFDETIWDNILLGMAEPDVATVEMAIRCSGLNSFVAHSVEGYMRKVGARGSALSSGQRQAVLLARALLRDPAVLLLDEPTATLDITSEQAVITGLREATLGKTLLIATHRLALLDLVDRVIWLEDGKIIVDKPKAEVLAMMRRPDAPTHTTQKTGYAA